ncbi:unnamed protein product [Enterobius vermicularis]|uniref:Zinc finger, CCHC-type n=1 Tax=Enterobius vermicularis TaxID=51028 RepID=A0A0N4VLY7_ENTVE|nr:unnamed protein product [Enterobius vermicularis]
MLHVVHGIMISKTFILCKGHKITKVERAVGFTKISQYLGFELLKKELLNGEGGTKNQIDGQDARKRDRNDGQRVINNNFWIIFENLKTTVEQFLHSAKRNGGKVGVLQVVILPGSWTSEALVMDKERQDTKK